MSSLTKDTRFSDFCICLFLSEYYLNKQLCYMKIIQCICYASAKLKFSNFDITDSYRTEIPTIVTCGGRKWKQIRVRQLKNCQIFLTNFGRSFRAYLQHTGKVGIAGVLISHNFFEKITLMDPLHPTYCFSGIIQKLFASLDIKMVLYDNQKRKRQFTPKRPHLCVWWSIGGIINFEVLKPEQTMNTDRPSV